MKCDCGKIGENFKKISNLKLTLCPDCVERVSYIYSELKSERGHCYPKTLPENPNNIYGTIIKGTVTKKLLMKIKKLYKNEMAACDMGCQTPPLFEILWECKSAKDAVDHGYTEDLWYRCIFVGRTIVEMEYCVRDIDAIVGTLEENEENKIPAPKLTEKQKKDLNTIISAM